MWATAEQLAARRLDGQERLVECHVLPSRELETHFFEVADVAEPQPFMKPDAGLVGRDDPGDHGVIPKLGRPRKNLLQEESANTLPLETPAHVDRILPGLRVPGLVPEPGEARIADDAPVPLGDDQRMHSTVSSEPLLPPGERLRLQVEGGRRGSDLVVVNLEQLRKVAFPRSPDLRLRSGCGLRGPGLVHGSRFMGLFDLGIFQGTPRKRGAPCLPRNLIRLNARTLRRVSISRSGLRLRMQIFTSGFAVMALELLGSRLVTPIFGSSIWTWGSLIGVVLSGLAAGYRFGGLMADRSPTPRKFSMIVFAGGILVLLVPFIAPYALSLSQYAGLGDEYGPLLGTALILLLPTLVLGMTSPYAIKLASQTLSSVGNVSGNLYSLSTVGSIAGTFGTVFILVPLLDVRVIILSLGLAVIGVSLFGLPRCSVT